MIEVYLNNAVEIIVAIALVTAGAAGGMLADYWIDYRGVGR